MYENTKLTIMAHERLPILCVCEKLDCIDTDETTQMKIRFHLLRNRSLTVYHSTIVRHERVVRNYLHIWQYIGIKRFGIKSRIYQLKSYLH